MNALVDSRPLQAATYAAPLQARQDRNPAGSSFSGILTGALAASGAQAATVSPTSMAGASAPGQALGATLLAPTPLSDGAPQGTTPVTQGLATLVVEAAAPDTSPPLGAVTPQAMMSEATSVQGGQAVVESTLATPGESTNPSAGPPPAPRAATAPAQARGAASNRPTTPFSVAPRLPAPQEQGAVVADGRVGADASGQPTAPDVSNSTGGDQAPTPIPLARETKWSPQTATDETGTLQAAAPAPASATMPTGADRTPGHGSLTRVQNVSGRQRQLVPRREDADESTPANATQILSSSAQADTQVAATPAFPSTDSAALPRNLGQGDTAEPASTASGAKRDPDQPQGREVAKLAPGAALANHHVIRDAGLDAGGTTQPDLAAMQTAAQSERPQAADWASAAAGVNAGTPQDLAAVPLSGMAVNGTTQASIPEASDPTAQRTEPPARAGSIGAARPAAQVSPALVNIASSASGAQRMTVRLDPAELGEVTIRIERATRDAPVHIAVEASRPETLQLLRQDQPALHRALDLAGMPPEGRVIVLQESHGESAAQLTGGSDAGGASPGSGQQRDERGSGRQSANDFGSQDTSDDPGRDASRRRALWARASVDITA